MTESTPRMSDHEHAVDAPLTPNFQVIDPGAWELMSPDDQLDVERAYRLMTLPAEHFAETGRGLEIEDVSSEIKRCIEEAGIDRFTNGFKILRRLTVDKEHGGQEPRPIAEEDRTKVEPWLKTVGDHGLPVAEWQGHDVDFHLIGALLSTANMTNISAAYARKAQGLPDNERGDAGELLDSLTFYTQFTWRRPDVAIDVTARSMAGSLEELEEITGLFGFTDEQALKHATDQLTLVHDIQSVPLFLATPEVHDELELTGQH